MAEVRRVCVLGSTGSVGQNTLRVIQQHSSKFQVVGLSCGRSLELLIPQIRQFSPQFVSVGSQEVATQLESELKKEGLTGVQLFFGDEGHRQMVKESQPEVVMASMLGSFGLKATLQAIEQNCEILGIANKEVLVMAGKFINQALQKSNTKMLPVDSEHSAIFQALMGNRIEDVRRIILTASGGPFRKLPLNEFKNIKKEQALKHPNWVMGAKITIDSATMMNKGLEYIEAIQLFGVEPQQLQIVVHPQSLVHSMVEYKDHSIMAQLGLSDMKIPIALALSYPERLSLDFERPLNLSQIGSLEFEEPDLDRFPCLRLAIEAERAGPEGSLALNAANEVMVGAFLNERIGFMDIPRGIELALEEFSQQSVSSLEDVIELDRIVKDWTEAAIAGGLANSAKEMSSR